MSPVFARHGDTTDMSHSSHDMSSMDTTDTSSTSSDSMTMSMFFVDSHTTPLFTSSFAPENNGQYAGICIFLIVFAIIGRLLMAFRSKLETFWLDKDNERRYVVVAGKTELSEQLSKEESVRNLVLSENGVEQNVKVVERKTPKPRPFRLSVDVVRAAVDTVIAGVGYLLMLAVMTMNVGYFCSVLSGVFIGTLLVGRFITIVEH
ncbi:hypothetical protein Cpir12675_002641 [Ceratocystis pirilliformis]|uniref:Copper transport protein n=1 Tax=Ceratocystis pirilliformis TaxID=259994 RepID=A0ABR3Z8I3_9PEZI